MLFYIQVALTVLASVAVVLILVVAIMAIVRMPGILRELERGNRQADAVVINQLNDIIKRLGDLEKSAKERA